MGKYFKISELLHSDIAEREHIDNTPDDGDLENLQKLIDAVLDPVRERFGSGIYVTSGLRKELLNKRVKGSPTSQHKKGEAADLVPCNGNVIGLFNLCCEMIKNGEINVGQLINENNGAWVHISLPTEKLHNQILHING